MLGLIICGVSQNSTSPTGFLIPNDHAYCAPAELFDGAFCATKPVRFQNKHQKFGVEPQERSYDGAYKTPENGASWILS